MNFKTTYILFAILGVVLVVFAVALWMGPSTAGESKWVLPSVHDAANPVDAKDIDTVVIERSQPKAEKLVFVKDGDRWKMTEPHTFRVDRYLVDQVVRQVLDTQREEKADLTSDLKQWELDSPRVVVTLKKNDDKEWKVNLGAESRGGTSAVVYVTSSERPKEPMAVRRTSLDTVFKDVNDFRAKDLLAESGFDIEAVDIKKGTSEVALKKVEQGQWRFTQPPYGEADYQGESPAFGGADAKPSPSVSSLLQALSAIKVASTGDFVADDVSDLAKYGLEANKPALMSIQVKHTSSQAKTPVTDTLLIGKEDVVKKTTKKDGKDETAETKYRFARLESEKNVVRIDPKGLELVTKLLDDPAAFRDRDLVHVEAPRVDAIDVKNANVSGLELRKNKQNEWMLRLGDSGKGQRADNESIQKLLDALAVKRQIKDFPDPKTSKESDLGLDKPVAVVSLWEGAVQAEEKKEEKKDGDKKDEKKEPEKKESEKKEAEFPTLKADVRDKPKVKLSFGAKDVNKGIVYVKRQVGDEVTLAAVPDTLLDLVTRGPLAYRDRTLPHLALDADVTKIVLTRPDGTYELEKETKDKKTTWKFKQPKELAGRTANAFNVDDLINVLRRLDAQRLETEKASEADLDQKYGLKSPQIKVTLTATTKDKKPEERTYLFGKETADGLFAKLGDQDLVFVAGKFLLSTLNNPLQDPTVFSFDANKVKSMKLVGWQDVVGSPVTLELERESAVKWTAKVPKDFNLDPSKAETFLASLANLKSDSFVAAKDAPKPEVFELKAGALEVEVNVDKEEPYKLTVGGLDADKKHYYAKSNKLPNQFFLLAKDRFETVKSKPAHFSK